MQEETLLKIIESQQETIKKLLAIIDKLSNEQKKAKAMPKPEANPWVDNPWDTYPWKPYPDITPYSPPTQPYTLTFADNLIERLYSD